MMMDFAGRLKRLRIEKGYSQATLAKKITDAGQKPGEASIAKYENGRREAGADEDAHYHPRQAHVPDRRLHGGLLRGFNRLSCLWRESRGRFG